MTAAPPAELADVIDRYDHVSMAVEDFESVDALVALLGAQRFDGGYAASADFHWVQYELPGTGRLEMIRTDSTDPDHFINRFLATHGEGLHHLTFKVNDLEAAAAAATEKGFTLVGYDESDPGWKEVFIHPRSANGVLIQLAEFSAEEP
ncbi:MAG: VOC family protein [Acidimicrobiia bacterium]